MQADGHSTAPESTEPRLAARLPEPQRETRQRGRSPAAGARGEVPRSVGVLRVAADRVRGCEAGAGEAYGRGEVTVAVKIADA